VLSKRFVHDVLLEIITQRPDRPQRVWLVAG
jgi:hypothetical protein